MSVRRDFATFGLASVVSSAFAAVSALVLYKSLSDAEYGAVGVAGATSRAAFLIGANWLVTGILPFARDEALSRRTILRPATWVAAASLLATGIAAVIALAAFRSSGASPFVMLWAFAIAVETTSGQLVHAAGAPYIAGLSGAISRGLGVPLTLWVARTWPDHGSAILVMIGVSGIAASCNVTWLVKGGWLSRDDRGPWQDRKFRDYLRTSLPFIAVGVAFWLSNWADVNVVAFVLGVKATASYFFATQVHAVLMGATVAISVSLFPRISNWLQAGEDAKVDRFMRTDSLYLGAIATAGVVGGGPLIVEALRLLEPEKMNDATAPLRWMLAATTGVTNQFFVIPLLTARRQNFALSVASVGASAIGFVVSVLGAGSGTAAAASGRFAWSILLVAFLSHTAGTGTRTALARLSLSLVGLAIPLSALAGERAALIIPGIIAGSMVAISLRGGKAALAWRHLND